MNKVTRLHLGKDLKQGRGISHMSTCRRGIPEEGRPVKVSPAEEYLASPRNRADIAERME